MEGENKETKITSVEKERVKDSSRVEQGKRLAAISREAKERKARERAHLETEQQREQREAETPYVFVIPMVGIALGGYCLYHLYRPNNRKEREEPPKEEPLVWKGRRT